MTAPNSAGKKRKITSQDHLSEDVQELFAETYPSKEDIEKNIIRIDRPDGSFFCCVPLETEDTSYLVKIKVVVDKHPEETLEPLEPEEETPEDSQGETIEGADQISETEEEETED